MAEMPQPGIAVGCYVAVIFDSTWFPGEVTKIQMNSCTINFLAAKGENRFIWPTRKDELEVEKSGIFTVLPCPPEPVSQRYLGFAAEVYRSITSRVQDYLLENQK